MSKVDKKVTLAYAAIIGVVFVWGVSPLVISYVLDFYTPSIYSATAALISGIALLIICIPSLKQLNKDYLKIAVPTGLFNALANLLQKIGLQYTTPTQYAFLENLSCVVVPILLYFFVKKKPGVLTVSASALCLVGCFVLSGMNFSSGSIAFGKGEILCALAGCFYGVNIAATGAFAKKMNASLYVLIQTWVNVIVSFLIAILLNTIRVGGAPIEKIIFSWDIRHLLVLMGIALVSLAFCWIIRTNSMKYVSATVVAVMMPFSSVVTGVGSVALGAEPLTLSLVIGGLLVLASCCISSAEDVMQDRQLKAKQKSFNNQNEEK